MGAAAALAVSLLRASRFMSRQSPNRSFVFIDRCIRRAAHDSPRLGLRLASALFTLLRRDVFALLFLVVALGGIWLLVPLSVIAGALAANITFSLYRHELAAAARTIRNASEPRK
jgi:hypothetical protein